jgi:hypothetical protein
MSAAMESGDVTFVRSVAPKPIPLSLDYRCGKCGKPITKWAARIDPVTTQLVLTATCHGLDAELTIYLGLGGTLFTGGA